MSKDSYVDKEISRLVRSVHVDVPQNVDDRIRAAADLRSWHGPSVIQRFWFLALVPTAAAALVIAFLLSPSRLPLTRPPISEIRTQFELVDKNINVIFIQKPDFILHEEDINE